MNEIQKRSPAGMREERQVWKRVLGRHVELAGGVFPRILAVVWASLVVIDGRGKQFDFARQVLDSLDHAGPIADGFPGPMGELLPCDNRKCFCDIGMAGLKRVGV